ncbi:MAG: SIS domain-containing protein [Acidimicrobiia bacterium]|nr:SIS domain-containing protein [Acidimicrobiia bacterium]
MTLWTEIREQPDALRRLINGNQGSMGQIAAGIADAHPSWVLIAARGTSDNAARYAQYVLGARNRLSVGLAAPSLFSVYKQPPRLADALVVGISQSGESPDLVAVLEEANAQGRPTLAITNHADSPMARVAHSAIELHAGTEHAVAATKTYTAQLAAIALLSGALRGDIDDLEGLGADVERVLGEWDRIAEAATLFAEVGHAAVLGRGFNHSTAFEWALKLQEMTYVLAQPYSTADFLHGPLALVTRDFPILAVAPTGATHRAVHGLLERLQSEFGSRLAVISDNGATLGLADAAVRVPAVPEWLSPITAVVAAQVFCYCLARARGIDPDSPRSIEKVTRTT